MAKQCSAHTITGTIDGLTFYYHPDDGYLVRAKTSVTRERVLTSNGYRKTRDNAAEFRRAIMGGKLLRSALGELIKPVADGKLSSRMNKIFTAIIKSDNVNDHGKGERCIYSGDIGLLKGFNFNGKASLNNLFHIDYTSQVDKVTGAASIELPAFIPRVSIEPVGAARYIRIVSGLAVLNFEKGEKTVHELKSPLLEIGREPVKSMLFEHPGLPGVAPGSSVFLVFGIVFYAKPEEIGTGMLSKRKKRKVKAMARENGCVPFTGAVEVVEGWKVE